jgi:hypothetical protein
MSRLLSLARFPTPTGGPAPTPVVGSRRSGETLDGLREFERWLRRTGPEVDALVARLAAAAFGALGVRETGEANGR